MEKAFLIPEPFQFNPLKHHLEYIRLFVNDKIALENKSDPLSFLKELSHIGTSVMDVYSGELGIEYILNEILASLESQGLVTEISFGKWVGKGINDFKIISLKDGSEWTLKYHNDRRRFIHLFPARESLHSFRIKSNTLKSAILYIVLIGKDYVSGEDLNKVRKISGLSPVKGCADAEAIIKLIEKLRN